MVLPIIKGTWIIMYLVPSGSTPNEPNLPPYCPYFQVFEKRGHVREAMSEANYFVQVVIEGLIKPSKAVR